MPYTDFTKAEILADSSSPSGVRLITFLLTFPRFILAELNTHRVLSRNSASSRAIPTEKQIARVREYPFVPSFNKRVKGMGVGDPLNAAEQDLAQDLWLVARDQAAQAAEALNALDVDKSRANRLLEPFMWHTAVVTGTEWDNFFALRNHPDAQPEFQALAAMMVEVMNISVPAPLEYGQWHLPFLSPDELAVLADAPDQLEQWKRVSASRCARVSYDKHADQEDLANTLERAERLLEARPPHLSPTEHQARPATDEECNLYHGHFFVKEAFWGNLRGWVQFRKEIPNEDNAALLLETA